jgi:23S rRNA pseudouridine955/2504/2580 synthase
LIYQKETDPVLKKLKLTDFILHEDKEYLVINKWAGISTLSDRHDKVCLLDEVRKLYSSAQVCHRLDKYTSGVLVFAKQQDAYRSLALQFQGRSVRKAYHAIVEGRHQFSNKIIDLPLYQGRRGHVRVSKISGKHSETRVNTLQAFNTHSLLLCEPVTGRTHQIRVHLAAVGAPLATAEEHGAKTVADCRWVANKSFVERSYTTTHTDGTSASGVLLIGWNPQQGHVQSWMFSSDGGHAVGVWSPRESGWAAEVRGTTGDGVSTRAVNLLTRLDDDAYVWQSVQRFAGDRALADTDEVVIRRKVEP